MVGHCTFFTSIAPFLIDRLGVDAASVAPILLAYGVAGAAGLALAGTVLARRPQLGLVLAMATCAASVGVLALYSSNLPVAIGALVVLGLAFGALPPLLQTRLLHAASRRIRDTASAVYTTSFNAGIGAGALLGAVLLDRFGLGVVPAVYGGIVTASLVLVIVSDVVIRRRALG
jgi:DHA1 family inner membrane transport protein